MVKARFFWFVAWIGFNLVCNGTALDEDENLLRVDSNHVNSVSNNITAIANFYLTNTNQQSGSNERVSKMENRVERLQAIEDGVAHVSEFYERAFSRLNEVIVHAEWVLGIVLGVFGVIVPIWLQYNERQRSVAFMSEVRTDMRNVERRMETMRGEVDRLLDSVKKEVSESVRHAESVVGEVEKQTVTAYQVAQDSRSAVEEQGKQTADMSQLIIKCRKEIDELKGVKDALSELSRKNSEEFTRMKASMYYDSAKSWIEHYNIGHSDDAIYNVLRDIAQTIKCNVEINDVANLNAALELLQRVKNNTIGDNESLAQRIGEKMRSFRWPVSPELVKTIVEINEQLSQSQKNAAIAVYTSMVSSYGQVEGNGG